ncbi:glyoxalase [Amycolatopsis sp. MEPSY49]|uniref:glyoxalase n=1 Tax=Amycolatopsis sp. MEPSY49 TaxID=3151600 RepID=UPI003EF3DFDB
MTNIDSITLEVTDTAAAERFYADAFGLTTQLRFRTAQEPSSGFRGYTLSLTVAQPGDVDSLMAGAVAAGATTLKPAAKSLWGYGGAVQAPDGAIWTLATSNKKDTGPVTREFDAIVLLLGVADIAATKKFYVDHGLTVAKSFSRMYVEFEGGEIKLALYRRKALAKQAGVAHEGSGSHRIAVNHASGAFTDPDGFAWEVTTSQSLDA